MMGIWHPRLTTLSDDTTDRIQPSWWNDGHVIDPGSITWEMLSDEVKAHILGLPNQTVYPLGIGVRGAPGLPAVSGADPVEWTISAPLTLSSGQHDVVYQNVIFRGTPSGSSDGAAMVKITNAYNISFINCVFETCGSSVLGNSVHIWSQSNGAYVHGLLFRNCTFQEQKRMQFECNGTLAASNPYGYHDITIEDCVFENCCGEILSFDNRLTGDGSGGPPPDCGDLVIQRNLFKGAGKTTDFGFTHGFEFGGSGSPSGTSGRVANVVFRDNICWRTRTKWLNFSYQGVVNLTMEDCLFDDAENPDSIAYGSTGMERISGVMTNSEIRRCNFYAAGLSQAYGAGLFYSWSGSGNLIEDCEFTDTDTSAAGWYPNTFNLSNTDIYNTLFDMPAKGLVCGGTGLRLHDIDWGSTPSPHYTGSGVSED